MGIPRPLLTTRVFFFLNNSQLELLNQMKTCSSDDILGKTTPIDAFNLIFFLNLNDIVLPLATVEVNG